MIANPPELQPHYETRATAVNAIESQVWVLGPATDFAVTLAIGGTASDLLRSQEVEQEVLDMLDEPPGR